MGMNSRRALLESLVVVALGVLGGLAARALPLRAPAGAVVFGRTNEALRVEGVLEPALVGLNTLTVTVHDAAGRPVERAEVEVTWFPQDAGLTVTRSLGEDGAGRYSVRNLALAEAGRWQLLLRLRVAEQPTLWVVDWVTGPGDDLRLAEAPAPRAAWIDLVNGYGVPVMAAVFGASVLIWSARVVGGWLRLR
jgi:hypothetical protein